MPTSQKSKLDAKARKYIFINYNERKKGVEVNGSLSDKFALSRDVFDEASSYFAPQGYHR